MLDKIKLMLREQKFAEAEAACEKAIRKNPTDSQLHHLMAFAKVRLGKLDHALKHASEACALSPDQILLHFSLGEMQLAAGKMEAARESFERIIKLDPNTTTAYLQLARMDLAMRDFESAESRFKLALRTGENRSDVMAGYATVLLETDRVDDAIRYLRRGLEINPGDAGCHLLLGKAFLKKGTIAFAENEFRNALALQNDLVSARIHLAETLSSLARHKEAAAVVRPMLDHPETAALGHATLGDLARAQGEIYAAGVCYNTALQVNPRMPRVIEALAFCELRMNNPTAAAHLFEKIMLLEPSNLNAERNRNQALILSGRIQDAKTAFENWLKRFPNDADARASFATALELSKDFALAEQQADEALKIDEKIAPAILLKARREMASGNFAKARSRLAAMGNSAKTNMQAVRFALLGHSFDRTDEPSGALKSWLTALKMNQQALPDLPIKSPVAELSSAIEVARRAGCDNQDKLDPVFLVGMPGSGVEHVGALIADLPGVRMLADRVGPPQRLDDFSDSNPEQIWQNINENQPRLSARRYRRGLTHLGVGQEIFVDWLPQWNAYYLPLIHRTFAKPRFILVTRDSRDCLLNWLAFGSSIGVGFETVELFADYLHAADSHLDYLRATHGENVLTLDASRVIDDPQDVQNQVANFLGVAPSAPSHNFIRLNANVIGLPTLFPDNTWQRYQSVLQDAFERLA